MMRSARRDALAYETRDGSLIRELQTVIGDGT